MIFRDRSHAGRELAHELRGLAERDPVVLALPRGGVPVGYEIAQALGAPLDLILVRKIGAPFQPELAVAAVVDGGPSDLVTNDDVIDMLGLSEAYVREEAARQLEEIERRRATYLGGRAPIPLAGRTAIVVDDGVATGATVRAALRALRRRQPAHLVLALPVAPADTLPALRREVDEGVCLATPEPFGAIGRFYDDFTQVSDEDVRRLLAWSAPSSAAVGHGSSA